MWAHLVLLWAAGSLAVPARAHLFDEGSISFEEGSYFTVRCGAARGERARPERRMRFRRVTLLSCDLPANVSYRDALAAVNVEVEDQLELLELPPGASLAEDSFVGLESLVDLKIHADLNGPLIPAHPLCLSRLSSLRALSLQRVHAARLPARLDELRARHTGLAVLPPRAQATVLLEITEPEMLLSGPLQECVRLRNLTLADIAGENLPEGLVSACASLVSLQLRGVRVRRLPGALLLGAARLLHLAVTRTLVTSLPRDLLAHAPRLRTLNLDDNQLLSLPSELFSKAPQLEEVSLARNRLSARALRSLGALHALRTLSLDGNPLGDLCDDDLGPSLLSPVMGQLSQLSELSVSRVSLSRVCVEWLRAPRLRVLHAARNDVRRVQCAHVQVSRAASLPPLHVDLAGNPLEEVRCTERDYDAAADHLARAGKPSAQVSFATDARLRCDCGAYWAARVLQERSIHRLEPRCARAHSAAGDIPLDTPLRHVPLARLSCALPAAACARACTCEHAPHALGLRARCSGPRLPVRELQQAAEGNGHNLVELVALDANVTTIPANLPLSLKVLDLRNNSISRGSTDAAAELFAGGRRVRLAGNELSCACDNRPLLDVLRAHSHLVPEYASLRCADGRPLEPATDALMCDYEPTGYQPRTLVALAVPPLVLVLLLAGAGAVLSRPRARRRLKAALRTRTSRGTSDAGALYDVFVSHAERDERFVAEQLVPRLESCWRVCVSYRDWPGGAWLPAQLEASLRHARRALCVVSPRALSDPWARAELRAAHATALRAARPALVLPPVQLQPGPGLCASCRRARSATRGRAPSCGPRTRPPCAPHGPS